MTPRSIVFLVIISLSGGLVLATVEEATLALFGSVLAINAALVVILSRGEL